MSDKVTDLRIQQVGRYTVPVADNADCTVCHDADYGDVLINGVCGKCLLAENERLNVNIDAISHMLDATTAELTAERERNRWRKYPNEKPTEDRWYLVASEIDDSTLYPEREHKVFYKVENSRYSPEWGFNKQDWHITHWCKLALPEEE